jgi:hypothetical protein
MWEGDKPGIIHFITKKWDNEYLSNNLELFTADELSARFSAS